MTADPDEILRRCAPQNDRRGSKKRFPTFPLHGPARVERSEASRTRIRLARRYCNLRRMRVQGEGRLCKKPFSLACSFFTVFLHEQKDGAPQGASPVQNKSVHSTYEILRR